jgi:hypothetical protein
MDEGDQNRQLIDEQTEGTGRLRGGVERAREGADRVWLAVEDAGWFLREHFVWPVEDSLDRLGRRGAIGVFGGGGVAVAGVVAALVIAGSGGSGSIAGTTEAFVTPQRTPAPAAAAAAPSPAAKPKVAKPTGPTLHGAPPDFSAAKDVRSGVADGQALGAKRSDGTGGTPAERGAKGDDGTATSASAADAGRASAAATTSRATAPNDTPASTAKIGATPAASASAQAQADELATASSAGVTGTGTNGAAKADPNGANGNEPAGRPAPKAAKKVARRFAEAFVVYEIGGIDTKVRKAFNRTTTKQLSRSLLHRPPRQPASVQVPKAKVVNVVAGPSKGKVYTVSVSLLRVGVTSELRLEMEQGVGKKWQVTNVLG